VTSYDPAPHVPFCEPQQKKIFTPTTGELPFHRRTVRENATLYTGVCMYMHVYVCVCVCVCMCVCVCCIFLATSSAVSESKARSCKKLGYRFCEIMIDLLHCPSRFDRIAIKLTVHRQFISPGHQGFCKHPLPTKYQFLAVRNNISTYNFSEMHFYAFLPVQPSSCQPP
jgi:hypothetical protein